MHRTKDRSHFSLEEAAVLGQLRQQKPSASTKESFLWIGLEKEDEKAPKLAQVRHERIIIQVASLREKFARLMEVQEEEVSPLQRICSQRNRLVETEEEGKVPQFRSKVRSGYAKSVASAKESGMEKTEEEVESEVRS